MTIFLNNSLLITRPRQESVAFSKHVFKLNKHINTISGPLFEIERIEVKRDLSGFTSLIVTSTNAIRSLKASQLTFKGKVFCVGQATARFAEKQGFNSISSNGDSNQLVRLIEQSTSARTENLLYLRGEEIIVDLASILRKKKYDIDEVICYRKLPKKLNLKIIDAINRNTIVGATFFSKQTVSLFLKSVTKLPDGFMAFCISNEVSRAILSGYPKSQIVVRTAKFPTMEEMCKLIVTAPELNSQADCKSFQDWN